MLSYQFYSVAERSCRVGEHDVGAGQGCQALVKVVTVQNANLEIDTVECRLSNAENPNYSEI